MSSDPIDVLARDVHYAIRDAGLAPESPADDAAMRDVILRTLAQQPAAVDEATRRDAERYRYLRRPEAWKEDHITEGGASAIFIGDGWRGKAKDGEALDAAIDRILAGQQQGGES